MKDAMLYAADLGLRLDNPQQALDAMSCGVSGCIFTERDLHPEFFDLSNGLAGEVFQKFSTYQFHAAFVIADFEQLSPRVAELALDHQNHPCVRLFGDVAEAEAWIKLLQQQQQ